MCAIYMDLWNAVLRNGERPRAGVMLMPCGEHNVGKCYVTSANLMAARPLILSFRR